MTDVQTVGRAFATVFHVLQTRRDLLFPPLPLHEDADMTTT